ncbi:MAG: UDP-N-acetylmuramoyl-tripeptide--D-alanyl-D-alanine ligase [Opitutales bacterium]
MLAFLPANLAAWSGGVWSAPPERAVLGFGIDSRRIAPGDCFVALATARRDGHDFVGEAFARGAAAALVARPVEGAGAQLVVDSPERALQAIARAHREAFAGPVVGITGSAGKTSTKDLLHRLLGLDETLATEGNLNNTLGVPLTLLRLDPAVHRQAVIEAGINQAGEMDVLADCIRPDHAIVTSVGLAHAEGLGGREGIAREKARLPAAVPAGGLVLFPEDCLVYPPFRDLRARVLASAPGTGPHDGRLIFQTTGRAASTETRLGESAADPLSDRQRDNRQRQDREISQLKDGMGRPGGLLTIFGPARPPFSLSLPPMSEGMLRNTVHALALARELGVPDAVLAARLAGWRPSRQRGELFRAGPRVYYVDCYNANPDSMIDALRFFAANFATRPKRYVLGSMRELGELFAAGHRSVGQCLRLAPEDAAHFIGDGATAMREGALAAGNAPERLTVAPDAAAVRPALEHFAGAVFLKGSRAYALERLIPESAEPTTLEALAC